MGPTNVALVKLYQADQKLREAQGRLDATTKNVRIQERRGKDLTDRINACNADPRVKLGLVSTDICVGADLFFLYLWQARKKLRRRASGAAATAPGRPVP